MDNKDVNKIVQLNRSLGDKLIACLEEYNNSPDEKEKASIMDKMVLIEDIMEDIVVAFEPELGAYALDPFIITRSRNYG